jgi:uncharacterized protein (DUF4415 family)
VRLEWDEAKREENLRKHGIDCVDVEGLFEGYTATIADDRFEYRERRFVTFGLLDGRAVIVAHTEREGAIGSSPSERPRAVKNRATSQRSQTDWDRVDRLQDQEIDLSDIPEISPEQFARAIVRKGLQPVQRKAQVTLRVDADVLDWFRAKGAGYQSRMNAVLRAYKQAHERGR